MTRFTLARLTALALAALFALPAFAQPRDVTVEAIGLSRGDLRAMGDPVVTDRAALKSRVEALAADIDALGRLLEVVDNRRHRKVLGEQVEAMKGRLAALRAEVKAGAPARVQRRHRGDRGPGFSETVVEVPVEVPATPEPIELAPTAITGAEMSALRQAIKDATFRKDKLAVMALAAQGQLYSTDQARELVKLFSFDSDKVEVLATIHPRLVDPENFHTLLSSITHNSNRRTLMERVGVSTPE